MICLSSSAAAGFSVNMKMFVLLIFLCVIQITVSRPQETAAEARQEIRHNRPAIEQSYALAPPVLSNFRNPILEYLLQGGARAATRPATTCHVLHVQTLLIPNVRFASRQSADKIKQDPIDNFISSVTKLDSVVTSPVLHLQQRDKTTVETYPAVAVVIKTYDEAGVLRKAVTHYQPTLRGVQQNETTVRNHSVSSEEHTDKVHKVEYKEHREQASGDVHTELVIAAAERKRLNLNEAYIEQTNNVFSPAMYNTVTSMIEYGPDTEQSHLQRRRRKRESLKIRVKTHGDSYVSLDMEEPSNESLRLHDPRGGDLVLRKGGVTMAGPGGAATAYTGGTAIVGPYGTVYKSPEGQAIVGPYSKIINITDDMSFSDILEMHEASKKNQTKLPWERSQSTEGGYRSHGGAFAYKERFPITINDKRTGKRAQPVIRLHESELIKRIERIKTEALSKFAENVTEDVRMPSGNQTELVFRPKSKAEAGKDGVAVSAPVSHAVLYPGQTADIKFEPESVASDWLGEDIEERSRGHAVISPPPLSTILRPPNTGFDRKKKPQKPNKEENEGSEEVGEEQEEESSSQEQASDGVAISPPPEGASVAEAKPVGLAIAGPGGVAAAKPQGTAVAGPGGLAIARPVGTAIAGVEVEGSIPIGASQQQKNKKNKNGNKKPKQEKAETELELQYVGGLTGPIGNPQPKQFIEGKYYGGAAAQQPAALASDDIYFRGGLGRGEVRLGQFGNRYGFVPMRMAPKDRIQKRMDGQTYFHGLLGTDPYAMV